MYIESFIGETKGRLESLALVLGSQEENPGLIERILLVPHSKDPRFSGFYWTNAAGDIVISTNIMTGKVNLSDRDYTVARSKPITVISRTSISAE
jgi:two-component system, sporulation sensor kinase D